MKPQMRKFLVFITTKKLKRATNPSTTHRFPDLTVVSFQTFLRKELVSESSGCIFEVGQNLNLQ